MEHGASATAMTFAAYLARQYIARKGYKWATESEVDQLRAASDFVVTRANGLNFEIVCIVDCEARPTAGFWLPKAAVEDVGTKCFKYTGTLNRQRMPVRIQIIEAGRQITREDQARLAAYRRASLSAKVVPMAWIVDPGNRSAWSNSWQASLLGDGLFIRRLLRRPRVSEAELQPKPAAIVRPPRAPYVTVGLLFALTAVFVAEQVYGIGRSTGLFAPTIRTLIAFGGVNSKFVFEAGEWFRILSAAFVHADAVHLLFNGIALWFAGKLLERLVGAAWFMAMFLIGAVSGSLMSMALNPQTLISVGASGAISALLAAGFVCSFRLPDAAERTNIQMRLAQILVPALLPLAASGKDQQIDFAAHLGGAVSGLILGLAMLRIWPITSPLPRFRAVALAVSLAGLGVCLAGAAPFLRSYQLRRFSEHLIPADQMPRTEADGEARSLDLVARFPRDPRAHFLRAAVLLDAGDSPTAEKELWAALADEEVLRRGFSADFWAHVRSLLALTLHKNGDTPRAKIVAQPVCASTSHAERRQRLNDQHLCE